MLERDCGQIHFSHMLAIRALDVPVLVSPSARKLVNLKKKKKEVFLVKNLKGCSKLVLDDTLWAFLLDDSFWTNLCLQYPERVLRSPR